MCAKAIELGSLAASWVGPIFDSSNLADEFQTSSDPSRNLNRCRITFLSNRIWQSPINGTPAVMRVRKVRSLSRRDRPITDVRCYFGILEIYSLLVYFITAIVGCDRLVHSDAYFGTATFSSGNSYCHYRMGSGVRGRRIDVLDTSGVCTHESIFT